MSETETRKGVITLVANSLKEFMYLKGHKIEDEDDLLDNFYEKYDELYILAGDKIYEIKKEEDVTYENIYQANKLPNGDIEFLVQYYNGGESIGGAIGFAINQMNKRN